MESTLKILRDHLAEQVLIRLFDQQYGANNYAISPEHRILMGDLMDVQDEDLIKLRAYCLEALKEGYMPAIERYRGRFVVINNFEVGWDYPTDAPPKNIEIKLMRRLVGDPAIPNGERNRYSVIAHVTIEHYADRIWQEWIATGEHLKIADQIGRPVDQVAELKLSANQRRLLSILFQKTKRHIDPWKLPVPWLSKQFLKGVTTGNASRTLKELEQRGLIKRNVSPGGRTTHILLTSTGYVIAERLAETDSKE